MTLQGPLDLGDLPSECQEARDCFYASFHDHRIEIDHPVNLHPF